ncbi:hypothetical protein L861_13195 [Litchfieldella anticariensis FP35 = DSM 16096]|uniref:Fluoride-specific ion channel FluC n=1 Tax=Litchfieldella anticariensis (strain DSM 16096 / CECT 5854 / CIP 108499 / LMG 22089 / FP35) TaxID=1121939 RepID=S2L7L6_LITA3|nr:fluoride efflux transporter CrcB [Halomonas anticariensis]EPC00741.1 hypothetical protein L861_13195 [Halomonas anticariensis FP35 = DSM 16096]
MHAYFVNLSAVLLGSAIGGVARFWASALVGRWLGPRFPWGTLVVNISGSMLVGVLVSGMRTLETVVSLSSAEELLIVGVCGSYTTVSSFALQTFDLTRESRWRAACINVVTSFALCLLGIWLGWWLGSTLAFWMMGSA